MSRPLSLRKNSPSKPIVPRDASAPIASKNPLLPSQRRTGAGSGKAESGSPPSPTK